MVSKGISVTKRNIVNYWRDNIDKIGGKIKPSWDIAEDHCWLCGSNSGNQRCHIIPACMGGESVPFNLILLCEACHNLNPETIYYKDYWIWFKAMSEDIFLYQKGMLEEEILYQRMYGDELIKLIQGIDIMYLNENIEQYNFKHRDKYLIRSMATKVVLINKYFSEKLNPDIKSNIITSCKKLKLNIINQESTIIEEKSVEVKKEINDNAPITMEENYWTILKDIKMRNGF